MLMVSLEDVIEGCRNGDAAMQKELYDRYSAQFYALCRRYAYDDEMAKESLAEAFLAIFKGIQDYHGAGSFEVWMHTILVRQAVKVYRRDKKHVEMLSNPDMESAQVVALPIEQQMDLREAITTAMRALNDLQRQVFNLVAVDGYSFAEAAEMVQLPVHVTKYAYYTARDNLRVLLSKYLGRHYMKELET